MSFSTTSAPFLVPCSLFSHCLPPLLIINSAILYFKIPSLDGTAPLSFHPSSHWQSSQTLVTCSQSSYHLPFVTSVQKWLRARRKQLFHALGPLLVFIGLVSRSNISVEILLRSSALMSRTLNSCFSSSFECASPSSLLPPQPCLHSTPQMGPCKR